ncbi:MAG: YqeG family HAD IIIA-type phosphatase [Chitinophagales bacterium]
MLEAFRPAELAGAVPRIDLERLWAGGIRGFVLDVDNTLCVWDLGSPQVPQDVVDWAERAKARGFKLCIISNGRPARIAAVGERLGIPAIARARKPFGSGFRRALALLGTAPEATAMVGDQLLTDVLGANRMGLRSILVPALSCREFIGTKVNRMVEGVLRRLLGLPAVY